MTRNIQVVSEDNLPSQPFTETPGKYFGGHTIIRQGFASYKVQGVEFYQLGQGGAKGRYPVHFHMARKTLQPTPTQTDPTPEPLNYLKDCSIYDSMTRWVAVHATEGMYIARNVGYKSIGHGFYLEDATEINNKFYGNIGILAERPQCWTRYTIRARSPEFSPTTAAVIQPPTTTTTCRTAPTTTTPPSSGS